jgi:RNA polymerase sigma factor (TIGR02999 family)
MNDFTRVIARIDRGEPQAAEELLLLVYDELHRLAARRLAHERPGSTLQTTALVHEAYLRLVEAEDAGRWENRAHFFAAAAEAMRRILVEAARRRQRVKHGGERTRVDIDLVDVASDSARNDLVALDQALTRLAEIDPKAAKLVELRHFAGLTVAESAESLAISPRTADRLWAFARAWLLRELTDSDADPTRE